MFIPELNGISLALVASIESGHEIRRVFSAEKKKKKKMYAKVTEWL